MTGDLTGIRLSCENSPAPSHAAASLSASLGLNAASELRRGLPALRLSVPDHGLDGGQQGGPRRAVSRSLPGGRLCRTPTSPSRCWSAWSPPASTSGSAIAPTCGTCRSAACCSSRVTPLVFWWWSTLPRRESPARCSSSSTSGSACSRCWRPAQVWTLANYVLTTREAKRSFGFIGSGAILGWIVGGLATRVGGRAVRHREHAAAGGGRAVGLRRARRPDLARSARYVGNDTPASRPTSATRLPLCGSLQLIREFALPASRSPR